MIAAEQVDVATSTAGRTRRYLLERDKVLGPVLLLPAVLYLVAVVGYPLVLAILYAFSDVTTGSQTLHFVGWSTFRAAIDDPVFGTALRNSFIFTAISQVCVVILSTVLAFVLSTDFRGKWFFRFLVLMPWTTPVALSAVIWLWMLDSIFSPFNWLLVKLHLLAPGGHVVWLGSAHLAMGSVIALPVILVAVLFGIVFTFADMAVIFILTGGAPADATQVLASWAFYKGINGGNLAVGAADAVFMFPVLLGLAAIVLRFARRAEVA